MPSKRSKHPGARQNVRTSDDPVFCAGCGRSHPLPYCPLPLAKGRANDLPQQPHGDSLREELSDLLGMLDDTCMLLAEGNALEAANELPAARALLQSILGAI